MLDWIYDEHKIMKRKYRFIVTAILGILLLLVAVNVVFYKSRFAIPLGCVIYDFTGYYCPGCGAGRACRALVHGNIYQAFRFNPLMLIILPWLCLYIALAYGSWLFTGKDQISHRIPFWIPTVLWILVILYGVVRNINLYPFYLLAPTILWG